MIIAIDGPAGSGKSTIAKVLAQQLEIEYIDSGAIYRTFTLHGINSYPGGCHPDPVLTLSYRESNPLTLETSNPGFLPLFPGTADQKSTQGISGYNFNTVVFNLHFLF